MVSHLVRKGLGFVINRLELQLLSEIIQCSILELHCLCRWPSVCVISQKKHLITVPGWLWVLLTQFEVQLHGFSLRKKRFGLHNKSIGASTVVRIYIV